MAITEVRHGGNGTGGTSGTSGGTPEAEAGAMPGPARPNSGQPIVSTMGVEEEFLLVDRLTRAPVNRAAPVIQAASTTLGNQIQAEFYSCMAEICTQPTATATDLRTQLTALRTTLADAAHESGCLLIASGTPVIPPHDPIPVTNTTRYHRMAQQFSALVDGTLGIVCGCHVHIGTTNRAQALHLANHVRPWLPTLQALAVNSPFNGGIDSGYASWRSLEFSRWPTAGPAPLLNLDTYENTADALVASGILMDRRMIYWYARPSEHHPTVEFRVTDVNADLDTTILIALLLRGLCATILAETEQGSPPPAIPPARLRAAHQYAARYGSTGPALDPLTGTTVPAQTLTAALVTAATPGLHTAGDLTHIHHLLTHRHKGTGADRQRDTYDRTHRLHTVVDQLAEATTNT
ncbi:glutamate--cysteine ligase [Streptomyces sp. ISL-86]|uniref:carboxylate-amine ligase n=1 Tax=Streptomyces sp. ISL-86 TaxID=2819187 RepID=UPI002035B38F|nr:glutamate--cysteine ligase [Streptomyces sp. ISL-86]